MPALPIVLSCKTETKANARLLVQRVAQRLLRRQGLALGLLQQRQGVAYQRGNRAGAQVRGQLQRAQLLCLGQLRARIACWFWE